MYITQRQDQQIQTGTVAVGTTVLRVFGASSWAGASGNTKSRQGVTLCNLSTSAKLYVKKITKDAVLTGLVSASLADYILQAEDSIDILIGDGCDLAVVRTTGTDSVTATEFR